MIDTKTTSITDLIFNPQFKDWIKKGQPKCTEFSDLRESLLQEAIALIAIFESQQKQFSKQSINEKYTDLMTIIKSES